MKKFMFSLCVLLASALAVSGQPRPAECTHNLDYFLPEDGSTYDKNVPTPESVLGFKLGQQHVEWNQVVDYMRALAATSRRVSIRVTGYTYQHHPFIEVVFASPENLGRIEQIRSEHLKLTEPSLSGELNTADMPVITNLIYSVHGNEPSGVNSSIAVSYYLAAAQGAAIDSLLQNQIIVMTPGANPDGINRFASWVNSSRSLTDVSDPKSREFMEPWPSSRTNHYWADCNRDWLMAQHPEGINGLDIYFHWMPNVVVDQHEQTAPRPFYFSPGHPKRTHPLTPQLNQDLTAEISSYTARELDKIGTTYYSKEGYDDFYYGKGASYGDIHGSVCLLYEQGTTRGHLRRTPNGEWEFAWTVRNQARASYATLVAAASMRQRLLDYQRDYYKKSAADSRHEAVQGYVFNTRGSKSVAWYFLQNMERHHIDVYHLAKDYSKGGAQFLKEDSYVIPVVQKNSTMVKTLMENVLEFSDSTFYDISTWTSPHAFNLKYVPLKSVAGLIGDKVSGNVFPEGKVIGGLSNIGYVFENREFYSQKIVYELQRKGIRVSVSNRPFTLKCGGEERKMGYGTCQVLVQNQQIAAGQLYDTLADLARQTGVDVYSVSTSLMKDMDMASPAWKVLKQPKVAILVNRGMGVPDTGEIWYLLDYRFQMQPVLIESNTLKPNDLQSYNVIIAANGVPDISRECADALKDWVAAGGTVIATGKAWKWISKEQLLTIKAKNDSAVNNSVSNYKPYSDKSSSSAGNSIKGVILNCHLDKTHPIGWGFEQDEIPVMKNNNIILSPGKDTYASPSYYAAEPLLSGCISTKNLRLLGKTPAVIAESVGKGHVVVFIDDMNFRSYYFGTAKLFLNAVFFSNVI